MPNLVGGPGWTQDTLEGLYVLSGLEIFLTAPERACCTKTWWVSGSYVQPVFHHFPS